MHSQHKKAVGEEDRYFSFTGKSMGQVIRSDPKRCCQAIAGSGSDSKIEAFHSSKTPLAACYDKEKGECFGRILILKTVFPDYFNLIFTKECF